MKLIVTRPQHDVTTRYTSAWAEEVIAFAKKKGVEVIELIKDKANRQELEGRIKKLLPKLIFLNGHGSHDNVAGHDNEVLIKIGENHDLLAGKITYALSCNSGQTLGPKVAESKNTSYIGYKDDFIFVADGRFATRPLDDPRAKPFMESSNQVMLSILKGHNTEEAASRSKNLFREHYIKLSSSTTDIDSLHNSKNSLWGTSADGPVGNIADQDYNATTLAQSSTITLTSNRTLRSTASTTISQAVTVSQQNGQARGSFPTTHGGTGIPLGAVMAAVGSKGIPAPIKPGGQTASLVGGITQILSGGPITINSTISATGTNAVSDGGGGGGLVVIVSKTLIAGTGAINVSGANGGATGAARGGGGGYSGEPGGHAGIGGSGGGSGGHQGPAGAGGAGFIAGKAGGTADYAGGGGGSIDNVGNNGVGGNGGTIVLGLNKYIGYVGTTTVASTAGGQGDGGNTIAQGGTYGGGGGGGGSINYSTPAGAGGNGGDNGSGGGGAGSQAQSLQGNGGNGANGNANMIPFPHDSAYAGRHGGQGGGGGGSVVGGGTAGTGGSGGTGAAGAASLGYGDGAGGAGGNGGGAAGMVIMIAPSITYSGTVTGRLVQITGTDALDFIRGYYVD